jgi:glycosyltransferase involved in cell wall biosynthesis
MSGARKPTVLFVNHWARKLGGAELSLIDILHHASSRLRCVLVVTEDGPLVDTARSMGVDIEIISCRQSVAAIRRSGLLWRAALHLPTLFAYGLFLIRLARCIRRHAPRLVYANVPKSHCALLCLQRLGLAATTCYHIREIFEPRSAAARLYCALYRPDAACAIAISRAVRNALPGSLAHGATVIYNGVAPSPGSTRPKPHVPLRLVYLGRIVPWKGCEELIDIARLARDRFGDRIVVHLIGDTLYWRQSYRRQLTDAIFRKNLHNVVALHDATPRPYDVLGRYHLFCNASQNEPFGRSIAEAQACGLPVIAYDSGGVSEIVAHQQTGFLAPHGDAAAFVDAIGAFLQEPALLKTMSHAAQQRANTRFAREKQIPKIVDYIERHMR